MDSVPPATLCAEFSAGDFFTVCFCSPCVYGSGLAKYNRSTKTGENRPEGLCCDTLSEVGVLCGTFVIGGIVPCLTGVYLRSLRPGASENAAVACLAEIFGICSCAPCQMNQYRRSGVAVSESLL